MKKDLPPDSEKHIPLRSADKSAVTRPCVGPVAARLNGRWSGLAAGLIRLSIACYSVDEIMQYRTAQDVYNRE